MKISVINGSPKGNNSVTLQYIEYLKKRNAADDFSIIHAGQQIRQYEKPGAMDEAITELIGTDLILFAYPVYTSLAPYQLAKFIELIKKHPQAGKLAGKFVSQITTSMHFFDFTAHRYIVENALDLKMKVIEGHSAEMEDLLSAKGQKQLTDYYSRLKFAMKNDITAYTRSNHNVDANFTFERTTAEPDRKSAVAKADTVIVTDCEPENLSLKNMIEEFIDIYPRPVKVVNIGEFRFSGGCMGCTRCAATGDCVYKDGFQDLLRNEIQSSHAMIFAFSVKDHSMGTKFKIYDDRQFCNGHRTVVRGVYSAYIVHGALNTEQNLMDLLEAKAEISETPLTGIACDESQSQSETSESLKKLSLNLDFALKEKWDKPQSFYGIGGMKIFRDLIFVMRGLMKADHRFYKKHGIYDFPQKRKGLIIKMKLIGLLMSIPAVRRKAGNKMTEAILKPYKDVI
ncbi:MAG: NAD(P)H-dependent oxidoreductase [Spirochaetales bacterium]|nr:NAD(P)H-dependent oxidoreductase [Spirochaetales bacterium]